MMWANSGPTPICENIPNFSCSDCLNSKPVTGHVGMSRNWTCNANGDEDGSKI